MMVAVVVCSGALSTSAAHAAEPARPVEIAEVKSSVSSTRLGDVVKLLRAQAETEIAAIDWKQNPTKRRVRVAASLVRLESTSKGSTLRSQAVLSVALLDSKTGALLGMVEGRAESEGRRAAAALVERDAVSGAVKSAIGAIPEAVRRLK